MSLTVLLTADEMEKFSADPATRGAQPSASAPAPATQPPKPSPATNGTPATSTSIPSSPPQPSAAPHQPPASAAAPKPSAAPAAAASEPALAPAAPASQPLKYRHQWFQSSQGIELTVYAKGLTQERVHVQFGPQELHIVIRNPHGVQVKSQPLLRSTFAVHI